MISKIRVIDEQGRLFGKLNLIDFLVILFFFYSSMQICFFGYKIINKKKIMDKPLPLELRINKLKEINLNFVFYKLDPKVLNLISVGDKEIDNNGQVIGEILYLEKPEFFTYGVNVGGGGKLNIKDTTFKKMFAILRIKAEVRQDKLYYKDKRIMLNSLIDFKTDKYQAEAAYLSETKDRVVSEEMAQTEATPALEKRIDDIINRMGALENKIDDIERVKQEPGPVLKKF